MSLSHLILDENWNISDIRMNTQLSSNVMKDFVGPDIICWGLFIRRCSKSRPRCRRYVCQVMQEDRTSSKHALIMIRSALFQSSTACVVTVSIMMYFMYCVFNVCLPLDYSLHVQVDDDAKLSGDLTCAMHSIKSSVEDI